MSSIYLPEGLWQVTSEVWLPDHGLRTDTRRYATEARAVQQVIRTTRWPFPSRVAGIHYTDCDWEDVRDTLRTTVARAMVALDREEQTDELHGPG